MFPDGPGSNVEWSSLHCVRKRTAITTWNRGIDGSDVQARHERTHPRITRKSSSWSPQPVKAADVILAISKLKNTKSTVHDQINVQHIKESLMFTIPYIALIINTSIVTNVFPKPWKHSIITPIHKSGDIEEPINCRPMNLLTIQWLVKNIGKSHLNVLSYWSA